MNKDEFVAMIQKEIVEFGDSFEGTSFLPDTEEEWMEQWLGWCETSKDF